MATRRRVRRKSKRCRERYFDLSEHSEEVGREIALAVEARNWEHCGAIIRRARAEIEQHEAALADPLDMTVAEADLPVRIVVGLDRMGVQLMRELAAMTADDILSQPGFGVNTLHEIIQTLQKLGVGGRKTTLTDSQKMR